MYESDVLSTLDLAFAVNSYHEVFSGRTRSISNVASAASRTVTYMGHYCDQAFGASCSPSPGLGKLQYLSGTADNDRVRIVRISVRRTHSSILRLLWPSTWQSWGCASSHTSYLDITSAAQFSCRGDEASWTVWRGVRAGTAEGQRSGERASCR